MKNDNNTWFLKINKEIKFNKIEGGIEAKNVKATFSVKSEDDNNNIGVMFDSDKITYKVRHILTVKDDLLIHPCHT